jgi:hypothetical protein
LVLHADGAPLAETRHDSGARATEQEEAILRGAVACGARGASDLVLVSRVHRRLVVIESVDARLYVVDVRRRLVARDAL